MYTALTACLIPTNPALELAPQYHRFQGFKGGSLLPFVDVYRTRFIAPRLSFRSALEVVAQLESAACKNGDC
jgi:hypothetical protein